MIHPETEYIVQILVVVGDAAIEKPRCPHACKPGHSSPNLHEQKLLAYISGNLPAGNSPVLLRVEVMIREGMFSLPPNTL